MRNERDEHNTLCNYAPVNLESFIHLMHVNLRKSYTFFDFIKICYNFAANIFTCHTPTQATKNE